MSGRHRRLTIIECPQARDSTGSVQSICSACSCVQEMSAMLDLAKIADLVAGLGYHCDVSSQSNDCSVLKGIEQHWKSSVCIRCCFL